MVLVFIQGPVILEPGHLYEWSGVAVSPQAFLSMGVLSTASVPVGRVVLAQQVCQ